MDLNLGVIKEIRFDRLTDEQITDIADCVVLRQYHNTFFEGSVYDRHMGVCDRGKLCESCSSDWENCVGGIGVIKLNSPCYFNNNRAILRALNRLCVNCNLETCNCTYINNTTITSSTSTNFCVDKIQSRKQTYKFIEKKQKDKSKCEFDFFEENQKRYFTLKEIYNILIKSDLFISLMNYNLMVTPIYTRPYLIKGGQYLHNDISIIYNAIVKDVYKHIPDREIYDKIEMLLTQKKGKLLPNSSKVPQSLQGRIQGKEGLINSNVNGKRVDHSSRANITGHPNGTLTEIGIPIGMAKKMTILESIGRIIATQDIVSWIDKFKPLRVKKKNGETFKFTPHTKFKIIPDLKKEDFIERPLTNGDIVLFNRQPSLRPESIIAKKVRILYDNEDERNSQSHLNETSFPLSNYSSRKCNTFRLTLPCTPPLNADFDGDECNVHVLQDMVARIECYELMNPAEHLISSQKGTPLFIPVQDALIGSYIITCRDFIVSKEELFDIVYLLNYTYEQLLRKQELWKKINEQFLLRHETNFFSGQFVFSLCFSELFFYAQRSVNFTQVQNASLDSEFIIENGIIKYSSSPITKKIMCGGLKSILHNYYFSIGKWPTCALIDDIQKVTNYFLGRRGFTLGLSDCIIAPSSYVRAAAETLKSGLSEDYEQLLSTNKHTPFEANTILGRIEIELTKKNLITETNNFYKVVKSGAKGSMTNVVQISQLVGQQSIDGTQVKPEMTSGRTLAYFPPAKTAFEHHRKPKHIIESGFVKSSFYEGLTKSENLFHAKAGRRGVTDSVTKVSESGYTTKKICKFLENLVVEYDLSVRNNESKRIVQFLFGTDGMNPQRLPSEDGKKVYLTTEDFVRLGLHELSCLEEAIVIFRLVLSKIALGLRRPNIILQTFMNKIATQGTSILISMYSLRKANKNISFSDLNSSDDNDFSSTSVTNVSNSTLYENELVTILHFILFKRLFHPGSSIGATTGSNFGEITTQLLMNSFHHAGIKNKDISGGIKRLNQLLNRTCSPSEDVISVARITDEIYETLKIARSLCDDEFSKTILKLLMENRCHHLIDTVKQKTFSSIVKLSLFKKCRCFDNSCTVFFKKCNLIEYNNILYEIDQSKLDDSYIDYNFLKTIFSNCELITSDSLSNNFIRVPVTISKNDTEWDQIKEFTLSNRNCLNTNLSEGTIQHCEVEYEEALEDYEVIFKDVSMTIILRLPFIDSSSIYSSDPFSIAETFGIEAGRNCLFNEIIKVLSFDGADIDLRYVELICDAMCSDGKITSIVNSSGVLTNALFEKEIKKLTVHSIAKSSDPCVSIESSVFLGKVCPIGTGFIDLINK